MLKRLGSAVITALLIVGIPIVLATQGSLSSVHSVAVTIRHPGQSGHVLTEPLNGGVLAGVAVAVAWITWSWLVVCFSVEVVARLRGRPVSPLPASRHAQALVTLLVGTIMTIGSGVGSDHGPAVATGSSVARAPAFSWILTSEVVSHVDESDAGPNAQESHGATPVLYTVHPGDTLWSIAATQLGDALRWREIAALNRGREQSDGERLTDDNWILPGWRFELPPRCEVVPVSRARPVVDTPMVEGVDLRTAKAAGASPVPSRLRSQPIPGRPMIAGPPVDATRGQGHGRAESSVALRRSPGIPKEAIGFGLLGAGVVGLLLGMRRAQQRHRRTGLRITLPAGDLAVVEGGIRLGTDTEGADWVDLALRSLGDEAGRRGVPPPELLTVRLTDHHVEVRFAPEVSAGPAWPPFKEGRTPDRWVLERDESLRHTLGPDPWLATAPAPYPSIVTVGRDDSGPVLIDVERAGSIGVVGSDADGVLNAMVVELATARRADQVEMIVVGFDPRLEKFERVRVVESVSVALEQVRSRQRQRESLLVSGERRPRGSRGSWTPVILGTWPSSFAPRPPVVAKRMMSNAWSSRWGTEAGGS